MTFTEIMEYLMKNGANVNAANPDGQTVLMFAAGKGPSINYVVSGGRGSKIADFETT